MGKQFGELARMSGIVTYRLSPHEQKAFPDKPFDILMNVKRRIGENIFRVLPPFIVAYLIYDWANKDFVRRMRKNPKDFENDI